jgi:nucleoid DNA-binding protein
LNGFITALSIEKLLNGRKAMKHNRKTLAKLIADRLKIKEETVERVIKEFVETVREEVRKGGIIEIRGLASWKKNGKGRVKVKNFIKEG